MDVHLVCYGYYWLDLGFSMRCFNVALDFGAKPYEIEVLNTILSDEIQ